MPDDTIIDPLPKEPPAPVPADFLDVLCALDGSHASLEAVAQGASLAGPGARITLLVVTDAEARGTGIATHTAAISPDRAPDILALAEQVVLKAGLRVSAQIDPAGPPAEVILERSAAHDLLAMGAPSGSHLGALLVGRVTETALQAFATPLLFARKAPAATPFPRRILLASDGSEGSQELVVLAARIARAAAGGVILVHAVGVESHAGIRPIEAQARTLEQLLPENFEVHFEPASPHDAILERAHAAGASLIVMGSRHPRGLRSLGSVSARVVHDACCSVLLLPLDRSETA